MALDKVTTGVIADDAISLDKIATAWIANELKKKDRS